MHFLIVKEGIDAYGTLYNLFNLTSECVLTNYVIQWMTTCNVYIMLQSPLVEYDFQVSDLFVDLQDGVRLGRATHLLLDDSSLLTVVPYPL